MRYPLLRLRQAPPADFGNLLERDPGAPLAGGPADLRLPGRRAVPRAETDRSPGPDACNPVRRQREPDRWPGPGRPAEGPPQTHRLHDRQHAFSHRPSRRPVPGGPDGSVCPESVEFVYDGENKRAVKSSAAGKAYYVGRHFEVVNGIPTRYIFAGDVRLAKVTPSGVLHFHKDHLTSIAAVSNAFGEKVESADYIPFGQERHHSGQRVTHYKYTDQESDWETGLYNYKARLYDPISGVFISSDPYRSSNLAFDLIQGPKGKLGQGHFSFVGDKPGNSTRTDGTKTLVDFFSNTSQRLNRYAYVQNNPLNFIDPYGLEMSDILPGIGTAIVEGVNRGAYAFGEAAKATADIAVNGHPLAQTAIGISVVCVASPLLGDAAIISSFPTLTSISYKVAPYSEAAVEFTYGLLTETGPPRGLGYLSSGGMFVYQNLKEFFTSHNSDHGRK
ncbi:MAG: hypothetical protein EHM38_09800 [Geobacteraceae bacterium]|nr:MAG: hypothetical protein EHM38_09800 [Geobacteraceae bacterium]